jgi:hypothetical protein
MDAFRADEPGAEQVSRYEEPEGYAKAEYEAPRPNVFIQWKGTQSCCDYYCTCGEQWHLDTDFAYYTRCPACKQAYRVGCNITLYPLTPEQAAPHEDRIKEDPDWEPDEPEVPETPPREET